MSHTFILRARAFVFLVLFLGPYVAWADDFNISYVLNGGTASNSGMPTVYTVGVGETINGTPTRANSAFAGWCNDAELTDCAMSQTISDTDTGDKTFYASWSCNTGYGAAVDGQSCTANQYNVTYDCGSGNVTGNPPANAVATYNSDFSPVMIMKNLCERSGYILSGWAISGTNTVQSGKFKWTYSTDKTLTAQWVEFEPKFTITTTNMSAGNIFKYWQGSDGLFYVDWGDGTLQTINYRAVIPHTYETGGVHTIRFGGLATGYETNYKTDTPGAVSFGIKATSYNGTTQHAGTPLYVAGISGSLGAIYPSLANGNQPRFMSTFNGCANLTGSIPAGLFTGVTGTVSDSTKNAKMFSYTFEGCTGLTGAIPSTLFGDLNTLPGLAMFQYTFSGCTGLTGAIPSDLFAGVNGAPRAGVFSGTFYGCSGLSGQIPEELFTGIVGNASVATGDEYSMTHSDGSSTTYKNKATAAFASTFYNCSNLSGTIPENLFAGITGNAAYLFNSTFYGCSGLSGPIPEDLFSGITGVAEYMFGGTFNQTTHIDGTIPAGLFAGVTGAAKGLFYLTFQGCCSIESPIPSNLFAGVSGTGVDMFRSTFNMGNCGSNGYPENNLTGYVNPALFAGVTGSSSNIFYRTFNKSSMDTECPCGAHSATTAWGVSSIDGRAVCEPGLKPNEHYYTGDNGETACTTDCDFATTLKTKTDNTEAEYPIVSDKVTTPALVLQSGGTTCYVPLESGVDTFNLMWGQTVYHAGRLDEEIIN